MPPRPSSTRRSSPSRKPEPTAATCQAAIARTCSKDKKGRLWLIVTLESQAIDLKALNQALGAARFSFGKPELLFETLGVTPGSVTPFALINDLDLCVSVVLDAAMMAMERLNYHPLSNDATTAITPQGLLDLITSFGHQARIFDFSSLE